MKKDAALVVINDTTKSQQKTVIVLGAGRGGTSAVSGCLRELGVAMPDAHPLKHEWSPIVYDDDLINIERSRSNISQLNKNFDLWGWKSPKDLFRFPQFVSMIRSPHVIIVFRDPLDVSLSIRERESLPIEIGLAETTSVYRQISELVSMAAYPLALCSYRKMLDNPVGFVQQVSDWLEISVDGDAASSAAKFISPKKYRSISSAGNNEIIDKIELEKDIQDSYKSYIPKNIAKYISATAALQEQLDAASNQISHMKDLLFRTLQEEIGFNNNILDNQVLYQLYTLPHDNFKKVIEEIFIKIHANDEEITLNKDSDVNEINEIDELVTKIHVVDEAKIDEKKNENEDYSIDYSVMLNVYEQTRKNYMKKSAKRIEIQTSLDDFSSRIEMVKAVSNRAARKASALRD